MPSPWKLALPGPDHVPLPRPSYISKSEWDALFNARDRANWQRVVDLELGIAEEALEEGDLVTSCVLIRDACVVSIQDCGNLDPRGLALFERIMCYQPAIGKQYMSDVIGFCNKGDLRAQTAALRLAQARGRLSAMRNLGEFFSPEEHKELLRDLAFARNFALKSESLTLSTEILRLMQETVANAVRRALSRKATIEEVPEEEREECVAVVGRIMQGAIRTFLVDPREAEIPASPFDPRVSDSPGIIKLIGTCGELVKKHKFSPTDLGLEHLLRPPSK